MLEEIERNRKKKRMILFSKDSACLQPLIHMIDQQSRQTLILWALEEAELLCKYIELKYPNEIRPKMAIDQSLKWAQGQIKMPAAKRAILNCHAVAKELSNAADCAIVHAIGQACSSIHVKTHALGLVFYELTAIVLQNPNTYASIVEAKMEQFQTRLYELQIKMPHIVFSWAPFLKK